ncbi:MAG: stage II sporulation protein P [Defluviitaleaceae bacterium]|nr:stage II sporulation protein P [Defluviitaleaceae bacterium]MCL2240146.1 stage II sporulation protein P [Defluviitaleaceae bacterium]
MKKTAKRVARQRMILGLMLLCVVLSAGMLARPAGDIPLFGYEYDNGLPVAERGPHERVGSTFRDDGFIQDPESGFTRLQDVILLPPPDHIPPEINSRARVTPQYLEQLMDFTYVRTRIFLEDPSTMLLPGDIDVYEFIHADLRIDPTAPGPHVLIFHTHSTEWFIDTERYNPATGIVVVGRYLAHVLSEHYGLEVLHYTGSFDMPDGRPQVMGAYCRMEPVITALLAENPEIQLVIDLHRDGVRDGVGPFTRYVDGLPTAQLMFFNGLSRRNVNGQPVPTAWLPNPFQRENLQFSFQAQLAANQLFPGLNRRIYLRAYRFSLHMHPRSIFVEVGNQYNTLQEAKNAMHPLARILADVLLAGDYS